MCGRFSVNKTDAELEAFVGDKLPPAFARKEVFPTQPVLAVTPEGITTLHWGLKVDWVAKPLINARAETIAQKKTFAQAFQKQRCLVPTDGYWEWAPSKQKFYFHFEDNRLFWLGGIFYPDAEHGSKLVLITTAPNGIAEPIHDRMPVIIDQLEKDEWLHGHDKLFLTKIMQPKEMAGFVAE